MWCGCREALNVFFIDSRAAGPDQDRPGCCCCFTPELSAPTAAGLRCGVLARGRSTHGHSFSAASTGEEKARCADSRRGHWVSHNSEVSTSHAFAGSLHLTQAVPGPGDAGVVCRGHQPHQFYTRHRNNLSETGFSRIAPRDVSKPHKTY